MSKCRHCQCDFDARAWQIATSDFECDICRRKRQAEYRLRRKEAGNPVISGKMSREWHRAYQNSYFKNDENRERRNALMRSYRLAHSTKHHHEARHMVKRAIDAGKLVRQPCEICGATPTHAHHDDYGKPLDVRWLCPPHHYEHHAKATGQCLKGEE